MLIATSRWRLVAGVAGVALACTVLSWPRVMKHGPAFLPASSPPTSRRVWRSLLGVSLVEDVAQGSEVGGEDMHSDISAGSDHEVSIEPRHVEHADTPGVEGQDTHTHVGSTHTHGEGGAEREGEKEEDLENDPDFARKVARYITMILIGQLLLDVTLRYIESKVTANARQLLAELYKELTTMGIISFTLFLLQTFLRLNKHDVEGFELAHIFLFAMAGVYIVQSGILIARVHPLKQKMAHQNNLALKMWLFPSPPDSLVDKKADLGFQIVRQAFIDNHRLPPTFLYDRYLLAMYNQWVQLKLDISVWCWTAVILVFVLQICVAEVKNHHAFSVMINPYNFLAFGWVIFFFEVALSLIVSRAHSRVLAQLDSENTQRQLDGLRSGLSNHTAQSSMDSTTEEAECKMQKGLSWKPPPFKAHDSLRVLRSRLTVLENDSMRQMAHKHHNHHGRATLRSAHNKKVKKVQAEGGSYGFHRWEDVLLKRGSELFSLIRCLYVAIYVIPYARFHFSNHYHIAWEVLTYFATLFPAIVASAFLVPKRVTRSLLVESLTEFNLSACESVVEYMEEVDDAFLRLKCLLREQVSDADDEMEAIEAVFRGYDADGSGSISYEELRKGLERQDVHMSARWLRALVRFIDYDDSGSIELHEIKRILRAESMFKYDESFHSLNV